jgi:serine/threonine-protein kinase
MDNAPPSDHTAAAEPEPASRRPLFIAVALAAIVAVGGGTWFALTPGARPSTAVLHPPAGVVRPPATPPTTEEAGRSAQPAPVQPVSKPALSAALAEAPCALVGGDLGPPGETVALNGLVGQGAAEQAVRRAVDTAAVGARVEWHVVGVAGPFCPVLDLLRAQGPRFGVPSSGFALAFGGDRPGGGLLQLHDGEPIPLRITMPNFSAHLLVDVYDQAGTVAHLHPVSGEGSRLYSATVRKTLDAGTAGPPYGADLIVAIASSLPLADPRQAPSEDASAYLQKLHTEIDDIRKRGGRIAVDAMEIGLLSK